MRLRLILSFALIVVVAVVSVVIIARQGVANEVRAFMFRGTMVESDELVSALEAYYRYNGTLKGAAEALNFPERGQGRGRGAMGMAGMGMNQRLIVSDLNGEILYDTAQSTADGHLSDQEIDEAFPLKPNGQVIGYLFVEGGPVFTRNDEQLLVSRISRAALSAGLIAGGISLLLALILANRLLKPVRELTQAAEQMARGDLSQRVPVHGNDELAQLGRTFNQMTTSLQNAEENRRAITADIAHELRNPLAIQRANLEAIQDGVYEPTSENLRLVLEQNQLLSRLVDDLRTLALADAGQLELDHTPTNFKLLVERITGRYTAQAEERQIEIRVVSADPEAAFAQVKLDPIRVEQIISNLLSNALRHTPNAGYVHLKLSAQAYIVRLKVHDSGPGIPVEALPHVFDRFYRADKSRSRSEGGTGLGLAIARQLAEAHGGSLIAENHPTRGAVFTLTLPKAPHTS